MDFFFFFMLNDQIDNTYCNIYLQYLLWESGLVG